MKPEYLDKIKTEVAAWIIANATNRIAEANDIKKDIRKLQKKHKLGNEVFYVFGDFNNSNYKKIVRQRATDFFCRIIKSE